MSAAPLLDWIMIKARSNERAWDWMFASPPDKRAARLNLLLRDRPLCESFWIRCAEAEWDEPFEPESFPIGSAPSARELLRRSRAVGRGRAIAFALRRIQKEEGNAGLWDTLESELRNPAEREDSLWEDLLQILEPQDEQAAEAALEIALERGDLSRVADMLPWLGSAASLPSVERLSKKGLEHLSGSDFSWLFHRLLGLAPKAEREPLATEILREACRSDIAWAIPLALVSGGSAESGEKDAFALAASHGALGALNELLLEHPERLHDPARGADLLLEAIAAGRGAAVAWLIGRGGFLRDGLVDPAIRPALERLSEMQRSQRERRERWAEDALAWIRKYEGDEVFRSEKIALE